MTTRLLARRAGGLFLTAAVAAAAGCGGGGKPTGTVAGTVAYNGTPVTAGAVNFLSATGAAAQARLDGSGAYRVDGPLEAGEYKVYVTPREPEPVAPGTRAPRTGKFEVPPNFRDAVSSGVSVAVREGTNDIPVEFKN